MDAAEVQHHVMYRIGNAPLRHYPFPHVHVEEVFPAPFYAALMDNLPPTESYVSMTETGRINDDAYGARHVISMKTPDTSAFPHSLRPFWDEFLGWLLGRSFPVFALQRFGQHVNARFGGEMTSARFVPDLQIVRDFTSYSLGPHTDHPHKLVVFLFYLAAEGDPRHLGTSLYVPREPGFTCEGPQHHDRTGFIRVATAAYQPNSMLAFFKSAESFHGVEPLVDDGICRNLMQLSISHHLSEPGTYAPVPTLGVPYR